MAQALNESWQPKYPKKGSWLPNRAYPWASSLGAFQLHLLNLSTAAVSQVFDMSIGMTKAKASCLPVFTLIIQNTILLNCPIS